LERQVLGADSRVGDVERSAGGGGEDVAAGARIGDDQRHASIAGSIESRAGAGRQVHAAVETDRAASVAGDIDSAAGNIRSDIAVEVDRAAGATRDFDNVT